MYDQRPRQVDDGPLLDARQRLTEGDPGEVHPAAVQELDASPGRICRAEVQSDVRVPAAEGDDRIGHEMPYRDAARGDADRAAMAMAEFGEPAECGVQGADAAE